jgi:hypothetical protein
MMIALNKPFMIVVLESLSRVAVEGHTGRLFPLIASPTSFQLPALQTRIAATWRMQLTKHHPSVPPLI